MRPRPSQIALKISTLVVVTACFVVMGAALLISQNFKNILTLWGEDMQMTVYLDPDISSVGREGIEKKLKNSGKVSTIKFINQESALTDFRMQLASYAPDITKDEELMRLIPASLQVSLSKDIQPAEQSQVLQQLALMVKELEGVDDVSYGQEWIAKYSAFVGVVEKTLNLLGIVILMAALFVISNVVRASIHNRKEEIVVLEMIGATSAMIRKPFLIDGAFLGFTSAVLAVLICLGVFHGLKNLIIERLSFVQLGEHLSFLNPLMVILFIIGGALLGALASYLCVRRINDGFAGAQGA